jgi:CPA1 family monovalent cation:H+ antiporter
MGEAVVELLVVAGGGIIIGLAGGWIVAKVRQRLDDPLVEITVTLLTPYLLFVGAEQIGASGITSAVVSGLYLGVRDATISDSGTRLQAYGFWSTLVFLLESILFVLVGLQFPVVVDQLGDRSIGMLLVVGVVLALVVMAVRLLHQFTVLEVDERIGRREPIGWRERLVVGWAGMRGAVSLAVALAIPLELDSGAPFPEREVIIFLTIVVIVVTLVVQGLSLPALLKRLRFPEEEPDARRQAMARFSTVEAALDRIGELTFSGDLDRDALERARAMYAQRANQLAGECRDGVPDAESDAGAWLRLRLELLDIERARLLQMRDEGRITQPLLRAVEADLDLEASRLQRRMAAT